MWDEYLNFTASFIFRDCYRHMPGFSFFPKPVSLGLSETDGKELHCPVHD